METLNLAPLRWTESPSRVTILDNGDNRKTFLQVTSRLDLAAMCVNRPVEELPRILTILSPSHHLVASMALDRLFDAEPPLVALNLRRVLLHAQFMRNHLRKLYFLLSSLENPFVPFSLRGNPARLYAALHGQMDRVMDHVALIQEALTILGGRPEHPVSSVAGGVGRFLKAPHYPRLAEIAGQCLSFAEDLAAFLREEVFSDPEMEEKALGVSFSPMNCMSASKGSGQIAVKNHKADELDRLAEDVLFDKIAFHREAWTYKPFAYMKEKTWQSLDPDSSDGLFFVGPLARLNSREELQQPRAEQERRLLVDTIGPFPHFSVCAAYWALSVELLESAEQMAELCVEENLTGPAIRTEPNKMSHETSAVLESPQGLIAHRYVTNERLLVKELEVLDTAAANNALRCAIVQRAVEKSRQRNLPPDEMKTMIEVALLPF